MSKKTQLLPVPPDLKVIVSKEIIRESVEKKSSSCMIAQALRYMGASSTHVTAEAASFNMNGFRYTYPLPASAAAKLIAFDEDKNSVKPFVFRLSENQGFVRPMADRTKLKRTGPAKPRKKRGKMKTKRSTRRFHGLRVIEVQE